MRRPAASPVDPGTLEQISSSTSALRGEMDELRAMVRQLLEKQASLPLPPPPVELPPHQPAEPPSPVPDELKDYYTTLIQNAVADELAHEVIARAKDRLTEWQQRLDVVGPAGAQTFDFERLIPDAMLECIERMLPMAEALQLVEGRTKFVALIGPTGVGKTTTIAKLAAQFKLREHKRVGLVTTDTYRIAAVAQLKAYADILSLPIEVVYAPSELADVLQRMRDLDLVLIDTSGRSQNDAEHLGDLRAFLDAARQGAEAVLRMPKPSRGRKRKRGAKAEAGKAAADKVAAAPADHGAAGDDACKPLETHLVLSCTAHPAQVQEVVRRFTPLGVDRVVFTKLDEAVGVGVVLNIAHRLDVQLSYLTTGQDVPDDIEVGHRRRIAEMVLKGKVSPESGRPADESLGVVNDLA